MSRTCRSQSNAHARMMHACSFSLLIKVASQRLGFSKQLACPLHRPRPEANDARQVMLAGRAMPWLVGSSAVLTSA